jgi:hypothetical protein
MPSTYGSISPIKKGEMCNLCPSYAAVKAVIQEKTVLLCDIHAFLHSDTIWDSATAIYDRLDILPPKPTLP